MSLEKAISQINFEIQQIDQLFVTYKDLFEKCRVEEPSLIELTAIGSVLHSFYNGIENIFKTIGNKMDGKLPTSHHWHSELLRQMTDDTSNRAPVISEGLKGKLSEYLAFRHFYRNSYTFFLKWNELKKLADPVVSVWSECKAEFQMFIDNKSVALH